MAINKHIPTTSDALFGPFYRGSPEAECFYVRPGISLEDALQFAQTYIGHTLELMDVFRNDPHSGPEHMEDRFLALEAMLTPAAAIVSASLGGIAGQDNQEEDIPSEQPASTPIKTAVDTDAYDGLEQATMILDQAWHVARAVANQPHPESIDGMATLIQSAQSLVDKAVEELRQRKMVVPLEHT